MKKKLRFKIGDWVEVRALMHAEYETEQDNFQRYVRTQRRITSIPLRTPVRGQICGMRRVSLGRIQESMFEDPTRFIQQGVVMVWEVRVGMINAPYRVLDADVMADAPGGELPYFYCRQIALDAQERQRLQEIMRDAPRDERGRFKKV